MKIIKDNQSACIKYDIIDSKVSDKFATSGRIGGIMLKLKSMDKPTIIKMTIGETVLTDRELINGNHPYPSDSELLFHSTYMQRSIGKAFIEFNKGDAFEFKQYSDNVSEISLWFTELGTN